ncbi:hypothetical protein OF829_11515 [Sphingomonas sp. LB-2]|uniref:hypothetical protein n=1 Tax=Sphingomonas caeni TaxID=2984949 RepID=UPI002232858A|nr:hypothetical protein [Sphingomonas caeni]MCW3847869.1 hypothetical protein [Sphingomonas caeni]
MSKDVSDEAPPWAGAALNCIGWIPSADGHLSFSMIGAGTRPPCHRFSAMVPNGDMSGAQRKVAAFQLRRNTDLPWFFRRFSKQARHHWLLAGDSLAASYYTDPGKPHHILDHQGMLRGRIIFIPYQEDAPTGDPLHIGQAELTRQWEGVRKGIQRALRANRRADDQAAFHELEREIERMSELKFETTTIEFALFRTGELRLWITADEIVTVEPDDNYPRTDLYVGMDEIPYSHSLLRQAYYFVKDAVHHHVHHDGESDQIIPLVFHPDEDSDPEVKGEPSVSEQRWHRETLWGLSRTIEELVRKGTRETLRNALGFMCFAESFQSTLTGHVRKNGSLNHFAKICDFHQYDFKNLRESVKIALDRKSWSLPGRAAMVGSVLAVGLSSLIAANAIGNHPHPNEASMWEGWFSRFLYQAPYALPLICSGLITAAFLWIYSEVEFTRWFFGPALAWNRFVRSHVRHLVDKYEGAAKDWLAMALTALFYALPIGALGLVAYGLYAYIAG